MTRKILMNYAGSDSAEAMAATGANGVCAVVMSPRVPNMGIQPVPGVTTAWEIAGDNTGYSASGTGTPPPLDKAKRGIDDAAAWGARMVLLSDDAFPDNPLAPAWLSAMASYIRSKGLIPVGIAGSTNQTDVLHAAGCAVWHTLWCMLPAFRCLTCGHRWYGESWYKTPIERGPDTQWLLSGVPIPDTCPVCSETGETPDIQPVWMNPNTTPEEALQQVKDDFARSPHVDGDAVLISPAGMRERAVWLNNGYLFPADTPEHFQAVLDVLEDGWDGAEAVWCWNPAALSIEGLMEHPELVTLLAEHWKEAGVEPPPFPDPDIPVPDAPVEEAMATVKDKIEAMPLVEKQALDASMADMAAHLRANMTALDHEKAKLQIQLDAILNTRTLTEAKS